MRFGRVEGIVVRTGEGLRLTVTLETGSDLQVVREGEVPALRPPATRNDLDWIADQYTQETIAVDLAEQGWEAVGTSAPAERDPAAVTIGQSERYIVRRPFAPGGGFDG